MREKHDACSVEVLAHQTVDVLVGAALPAATLGLAVVALAYGLLWLAWTRDLWTAADDPLGRPREAVATAVGRAAR